MAKSPEVSWHVLLHEDNWDESGDAPVVYDESPSVSSSTGSGRKRALQLLGLLFALLFLCAYAFWDSAQAFQNPAGPTVSQPPPISADALAANARRILLAEHLRVDAVGGDIALAAATLSEMEAIYLDAFAALGLSPTHGEDAPDGRLLVVLRGTDAPVWERAAGRVTLPSPAALPAPAGTNRQELLRQAWRLALVDEVSRDVRDVYAIPRGWLPLLGGLRLWQLRDGGGPLGEAWDEVTARLYGVEGKHLTPNDIADLCVQYAAWDLAPIDHSIPLSCDEGVDSGLTRLPVAVGLTALYGSQNSEDAFGQDSVHSLMTFTSHRVVMALIFEYAAACCGEEKLPALLGALAQHESWDTLIPAVYGVSLEEFEEGWRAWREQKATNTGIRVYTYPQMTQIFTDGRAEICVHL